MKKTALITGATSGFGYATATTLINNGWNIIVTGRRKDRLLQLKEKLNTKNILILNFDIRKKEEIEENLDKISGPFSDIKMLVNNAGLALGTLPAQESNLHQWHQMIETNITGLATITYKLLPKLIKEKGFIFNISSVAGTYPYPGGNVYGGTKAFVTQFSLGLRSDLHGTGVRVTSIEPGMSETEFTLVRTGGDNNVSNKLYEGVNPMTGQDIADTILWLSKLPSHMNVNRIELMPVNQSFSPFQIHRNK